MIFWQSPKESCDDLFLAEKNCTTVSHEIVHEMLRIKGQKNTFMLFMMFGQNISMNN